MTDRKTRILSYLKEMTSVPSISDTEDEKLAAEYLAGCLARQAYLRRYPERMGEYRLKEDSLGRTVPYALVKGSGASKKTVVLTGHYDVVGIEEYASYRSLAFRTEELGAAYRQAELDEESLEDARSGEWLFGRGTADMKGGLAVGLAVLEEYGEMVLAGGGKGNLLFLAVPDEESYSAGMRGAVCLLNELRNREDLEYECLLDLEPGSREGNVQNVWIGSVGKCMPVVMVQGKKAHVGECFEGLNAIGVLGSFFNSTELSDSFADTCGSEVCVPPTWLYFKDMKQEYDVSVPLRACGYLSLLSFSSSPDAVMEKLKEHGREAFDNYIERMRFQKKNLDRKAGREFDGSSLVRPEECEVMEYRELLAYCRQKNSSGFDTFYQKLYGKIKEETEAGRFNYPQAAIEMMRSVLDFSGLTHPLVLIGFAPPFYPCYHSDRLPGREGDGSRYFDMAARAAEEAGLTLRKMNYFTGISDLSYCGAGITEDLSAYAGNTPLWGSLYRIDFDAVRELNLPALLLGPWGKGIHQRTERVNIKSMTEELPFIIFKILEQVFAK